jgi:hypothetical protein
MTRNDKSAAVQKYHCQWWKLADKVPLATPAKKPNGAEAPKTPNAMFLRLPALYAAPIMARLAGCTAASAKPCMAREIAKIAVFWQKPATVVQTRSQIMPNIKTGYPPCISAARANGRVAAATMTLWIHDAHAMLVVDEWKFSASESKIGPAPVNKYS